MTFQIRGIKTGAMIGIAPTESEAKIIADDYHKQTGEQYRVTTIQTVYVTDTVYVTNSLDTAEPNINDAADQVAKFLQKEYE